MRGSSWGLNEIMCAKSSAHSGCSVSLQCISSLSICSCGVSACLHHYSRSSLTVMTVKHKGQNHYQIVRQKTLRQPTVLYSWKMAMNHFTKNVSMFLLASSGPAAIGPPQSLLLLRSSPRNGRGGSGYAQDSSGPAPSPLLLHPWETHAPIEGWGGDPSPS